MLQVRMMNEYLTNIRFIKMYSWEKPLAKLMAGKSVIETIRAWAK